MPKPPRKRARSATLTKPGDVIDRDDVWTELVSHWSSAGPALLFGIGRRRAGKSWVLARFARAVDGVYYQATRRTEHEQLATLSRIVGRRFADRALQRGVPFPTWEDLFGYVAERAAGQPFLLVLDEFPYLAEAAPALTSILQAVWDHDWPGTRIKLVLNGSHITAMRQLEAADQPLYGRRTARLFFPPFEHEHVAAFAPGYSARDLLVAYGVFGGLPGHLTLLDPARTVGENVARHILDPAGRLFDEAQHMLDAFLGDADVHYSIIQAIANGERSWSRITSRLGKSSGSLSRPMRWLEEMQIVARTVPVTEAKPQTSKRTLYRITDPYLAFWHRFVAPLVATGEASLGSPGELWRDRVAPGLEDYMGTAFEDICRSWVGRTTRLPFRPTRLGAWWDAESRNEIDVVALGPAGHILVGECKWGAVNENDLATLRERAALLLSDLPERQRAGRIYHAVFSGSGAWSPAVATAISNGSVLGFTPEDLLAI